MTKSLKADVRVIIVSIILIISNLLSSKLFGNVSDRYEYFSIENFSNYKNYFWFNHLSISHLIVSCLFLSGLIIYIVTNGRNKKMLAFIFLLVFIENTVRIIFLTSKDVFLNGSNFKQYWDAVVYSNKYVLLAAMAFWMLYILKFTRFSFKYRPVETPTDIKKVYRVFHYVADFLLVVLIFSKHLFTFSLLSFSIINMDGYITNDLTTGILIIWWSLSIFIYYFLAEYIFLRTPAKILTGVVVISKKQKHRPSIWKILIRSLARIVPANEITILFDNLWHDKWSNTTLIKDKKLKEIQENVANETTQNETPVQ